MTLSCRVCEGTSLEQFLDLGDQPHCNSLLSPDQLDRHEPHYPLRVWFCHDCATVQIDHTVPKEEMFGEYLYVSGTTATLRQHFQASADRLVERLGLTSKDLVVDIGSNDGTWLKCYRKHGLRTLGVEPARNLAAMAAAQGVETVNRFFNAATARDVIAGYGHAKLVTAAGVFFHLEELLSVTQGVSELIGDEGVFCVQAIYLGNVLDYTKFDNVYHEHLTYWTLISIQRLFDQYDLEVFDVRFMPIHGGSMELLVARRGSRPVDSSVGRLGAEEKRKGYDRIDTYHAFAARVWQIRDELLGILNDFKERGKVVHAFGAPAKGATLLNSFGIGTELVPLAVERNPLKVGKYIPGVRIPIVDEQAAPIPDAYLVLPWNFLSEVLERKRGYIMNGGVFIVPIPRPVVIDSINYETYAA